MVRTGSCNRLVKRDGFSSPSCSPSLYKTIVLAFCIWLVVIWTYSGKISLQSIRNGGKWKSFINHLNLMLPWLNHLLEVSQSNHIFSSIIAVFKMECLKISNDINHFALRSKLYHKAIKTAFDELQVLKSV